MKILNIAIGFFNAQYTLNGGQLTLSWEKGNNTKSFVIYQFQRWHFKDSKNPARIFLTTGDNSVTYALDESTDPSVYKYVVTAISPTNSESAPVRLHRVK